MGIVKKLMEDDMTVEQAKLFNLGREVTLALPRLSSIARPNDEALSEAARKLGISKAKARRAHAMFMWN